MINQLTAKYGFESNEELMNAIRVHCFKFFAPTDNSVVELIRTAVQHDLNPFTGEIYPVQDVTANGDMIVRAEIGFTGWLAIAKRTPDYKGYSFNYSDKMVSLQGAQRHLVCHEFVEASITLGEMTHTIREYFDDNYVIGSPMWERHPKRRLRQVAFSQVANMCLDNVPSEEIAKSFASTEKEVKELQANVWDSFVPNDGSESSTPVVEVVGETKAEPVVEQIQQAEPEVVISQPEPVVEEVKPEPVLEQEETTSEPVAGEVVEQEIIPEPEVIEMTDAESFADSFVDCDHSEQEMVEQDIIEGEVEEVVEDVQPEMAEYDPTAFSSESVVEVESESEMAEYDPAALAQSSAVEVEVEAEPEMAEYDPSALAQAFVDAEVEPKVEVELPQKVVAALTHMCESANAGSLDKDGVDAIMQKVIGLDPSFEEAAKQFCKPLLEVDIL